MTKEERRDIARLAGLKSAQVRAKEASAKADEVRIEEGGREEERADKDQISLLAEGFCSSKLRPSRRPDER